MDIEKYKTEAYACPMCGVLYHDGRYIPLCMEAHRQNGSYRDKMIRQLQDRIEMLRKAEITRSG